MLSKAVAIPMVVPWPSFVSLETRVVKVGLAKPDPTAPSIIKPPMRSPILEKGIKNSATAIMTSPKTAVLCSPKQRVTL